MPTLPLRVERLARRLQSVAQLAFSAASRQQPADGAEYLIDTIEDLQAEARHLRRRLRRRHRR